MRLLLRALGKTLLAFLAIFTTLVLLILVWFGVNWLFEISGWLVFGLVALIILGVTTAANYDEIKYQMKYNNRK